jgi:hypothetical protein
LRAERAVATGLDIARQAMRPGSISSVRGWSVSLRSSSTLRLRLVLPVLPDKFLTDNPIRQM